LAAYGCCHGLDFASAEDVVQQVFLKLLEGRGRASVPVMPLAYLYRAVRNASLNLRRKQRTVEIGESEIWLVGPAGSREEALSVQAALPDLPE
jgi:DNA-directed RNA polymerase specialized sigma24 family protein